MKLDQSIDIKALVGKLFSQKEYLIIIGIFIVCFNISSRIYKSQTAKDESLQAQISERKQQVEHLNEIQVQIKQASVLKDKFKNVEMSDLINRVTEVANQNKLRVMIVDQQQKTEMNIFINYSFHLALEGTYHNFGKFLSAVENFEEFVKIDNVSVVHKSVEEGKNILTINITVLCSVLK